MALHYCYKKNVFLAYVLGVSGHEKHDGRDELVVAKLRGGVCLPLNS